MCMIQYGIHCWIFYCSGFIFYTPYELHMYLKWSLNSNSLPYTTWCGHGYLLSHAFLTNQDTWDHKLSNVSLISSNSPVLVTCLSTSGSSAISNKPASSWVYHSETHEVYCTAIGTQEHVWAY